MAKHTLKILLCEHRKIFKILDVWPILNIMHERVNPANIYLFKVNNRNTREICEIFQSEQ